MVPRVMKPIGSIYTDSVEPEPKSKKVTRAAFESNLLRVGDYYSRSFMQKLVRRFDLLGPEYGSVWFEPVINVPTSRVRFLRDEPMPSSPSIMAWRLYNHRLYKRTWGHGPWGHTRNKEES